MRIPLPIVSAGLAALLAGSLAFAPAAAAREAAAAAAPAPAGRLDLRLEGVGPSSDFRVRLELESRHAYARAAAWFGEELSGPVTVAWVTDEGELGGLAVENPGAIAGAAQPSGQRILLFAPALAPRPERVPTVLLHEFCHLLFARATAGAAVEPPRWLDEGLATWLSGDWDLGLAYRGDHESLLLDATAAGSVIPFRRLDGRFPSGPLFSLAYAQSRSFVEWLAARDDEAGLRRFLDLLDRDVDPEPAFEEAWGLTLEAAEKRWKRGLGRSGPLRFLPSGRSMFAFGSVLAAVLVLVRWIRVRRQLHRMKDEEAPLPPDSDPDR